MKINELVASNFSPLFEKKLRKEICNYGILKKVESENIILEIRRDIHFIPFVIKGVVKVMRRDGMGNGVLLHYITENQTSAIAVSYAREHKKSEIRLKSDGNVVYIAVPSKVVNSWFEKYETWNDYFFKYNQLQISSVIDKLSDIVFLSLEERLLKYLEQTSLMYNDNTIYKKHFDIASDLKVSREAISRILKKLEKEDVITLGRNKIIMN